MEMMPILGDLTNEQFESLLKICTKKVFPIFTVIFREGDQSEEMYILTDGVLKVTLRGKEISRILPMSTVGEMCIFTGKISSATVTTISKCTLLRIMKNDLFALFEKDKDFHIKFLNVMILDLANKVRISNEVIANLK